MSENARDCEHGSLRRQCLACEKDALISELCEALEAYVNAHSYCEICSAAHGLCDCNLCLKARAALLKARGEG